MSEVKKAIILLSGGLDSATTLAIAQAEGFECHALSFHYGQRHAIELKAAEAVAKAAGVVAHKITDIDLRLFGGSALTDDIAVPKHRDLAEEKQIPVTYVPARNTIFLSFALAWAEVLKAYDIFIGVNALDYSGYPDCRPEFIRAFENTANLATAYTISPPAGGGSVEEGGKDKKRIRIHTPLMSLTKGEIIRRGLELGVDYSLTLSCYDPDEKGCPCGACDSCRLRRRGFEEYNRPLSKLTTHCNS